MRAFSKWTGPAALVPALLVAAACGGNTPAGASTALLLKAERVGTDYRVSWSASSPAVLAGVSGNLAVDDGSFHRDIGLDKEQLRSAWLLYEPVTDDVTFTLTVTDGRGEKVTESRRLLADKLPEPAR